MKRRSFLKLCGVGLAAALAEGIRLTSVVHGQRIGEGGISLPTIINDGTALPFGQLVKQYFDLAYWPMNEASGDALDTSGNNFTAVYHGGVTHQAVPLPDGDKIPNFDGSASGDFYSSEFRDAFDPNKGTIIVLAKIANATWEDGQNRILFQVRNGNDKITIQKEHYYYCMTAWRTSDSDHEGFFYPEGKNDVMFLGLTWDVDANEIVLYSDGLKSSRISCGPNWTGIPSSTYTHIGLGSAYAADYHIGAVGHIGLSSSVLTAANMQSLFRSLYPVTDDLFVVGDSKAVGYVGAWRGIVMAGIETSTGKRCILNPTGFCIGGEDVGEMRAYVDANLASQTATPLKILINLGANDAVEPTPEVDFKIDYIHIIDALRIKWPGIPIYIAKVWRRDYPANCALLNSYIGYIVAHYASGVYDGPNEAIWLENGDNGATYTKDGIHYTNAGQSVCAAQWLKVIGA